MRGAERRKAKAFVAGERRVGREKKREESKRSKEAEPDLCVYEVRSKSRTARMATVETARDVADVGFSSRHCAL